jgi:hypothetical protein
LVIVMTFVVLLITTVLCTLAKITLSGGGGSMYSGGRTHTGTGWYSGIGSTNTATGGGGGGSTQKSGGGGGRKKIGGGGGGSNANTGSSNTSTGRST